MLVPPPLKPGDTVGIVAPSGPLDRKALEPALEYLETRGYSVRLGQALFERNRFLAGSDAARAADVNAMFSDDEVRAIFVARGGYGSARILGQIDFEAVENNPKSLVGFSDTTALQLALWTRANLLTWSGVTLVRDVKKAGPPAMNPITSESLWSALEKHHHAPIDGLQFLNGGGSASGPLIGGCLSLVASLVGTPWMPRLKKSLLFLEDVGEPPYCIDRMLNQLLQAGLADQVSGILFGRFEGYEPESDSEGTALDVLNDFASRVACPVALGLPYGHGDGRRVLPVGTRASLGSNGTLAFDTIGEDKL
jgi:muramoyltetrapeptide carboxypeptidase